MKNRTLPFVAFVCAAAAAVSALLYQQRHPIVQGEFVAIVVLATLALVAELLSYLLPRGALGSISSIPALAVILVSPTWDAVLAIAIVKVIVESSRRAPIEKAAFNVAQYNFSYGLAALLYQRLGGQSFYGLNEYTLGRLTVVNGVPAFAAFVTFFAANSILVSAVVALSSGTSLRSVWRANNVATVGIDILASPVIFLFAWAYDRFGAIAAAAIWVPIIGIRQLNKANLELEQTNEELLELMVKSIEARDPYTSGHSRRVQEYSSLIARALGLSEKEIQKISHAALLHDVGKIHEKYGPILRKADKLTLAEWNTMREHPADGAGLIATMTRLRDLVGPVRHHHENWDGTGYPDGVAGELIPLGARIIRFADTIDAMTTERPYRRSLSAEEVRAEMVRCRGTQFDPQIVDRLLSSPLWKTMFAPGSMDRARFGTLAVLPRAAKRTQTSVGA